MVHSSRYFSYLWLVLSSALWNNIFWEISEFHYLSSNLCSTHTADKRFIVDELNQYCPPYICFFSILYLAILTNNWIFKRQFKWKSNLPVITKTYKVSICLSFLFSNVILLKLSYWHYSYTQISWLTYPLSDLLIFFVFFFFLLIENKLYTLLTTISSVSCMIP